MKFLIFISLLFSLNIILRDEIGFNALTQPVLSNSVKIDVYSLPIANEAMVTTTIQLIVIALRKLLKAIDIELVIESSRIPKEISIYLNSLNTSRINLIVPLVHSP